MTLYKPKPSHKQQQAPEVEEEVDFFTDPDKAIASAISKHPKVREAEQLSAQMKKAEALANLKSAHPDFDKVVQDGSFAEWINKSKVRQEYLVEQIARMISTLRMSC